jgi:hypothetical protein
MGVATGKITWNGVLVGVQPRIRLTRSFDQRSHIYQGYMLRVQGAVGGENREVLVAVGEAAQAEHLADARAEIAEIYKVSKLKVLERGSAG